MSDQELVERLDRIERILDTLVKQREVKEYYSTEEVAQLVGRRPFTIRQYCNHGRIRAEKRQAGRGKHKEWMISHEELVRLQNEWVLPPPHRR